MLIGMRESGYKALTGSHCEEFIVLEELIIH
jgi:hypothetical protein